MRHIRRPMPTSLLVLGAAALLAPAGPASAAPVTETYRVPTVGGATIEVEVTRDPAVAKAPVLLTYSPYNTIREPNPSNDAYAARYVPRGYARAVADVLGTRGSTGCWDYGGPSEQRSGADVVRFLAAQPWSNGRVGMIGSSYDGTTANMVAALGLPELVAIVPISAISHWYGYAFGNGVRYFLNSQSAADEGFDTPLAFDYGFGRTIAADDPDPVGSAAERVGTCESYGAKHAWEGYSRTPDYDSFWLQRDYRKDASRFRAAVLLAHGWQDYNVKQEETTALWKAIPVDNPETKEAVEGVPFKRLYLTQGTHSGGTAGGEWQPLLDRFLDHTLLGADNGVNREPAVSITRGRATTSSGTYETLPPAFEASWPPPGTSDVTLHLRRKFDFDVPGVPAPTGETGELLTQGGNDGAWTWVDTGAVSEEASMRDPLNEPGHGYYSLFYRTPPLSRDVRLAGSALLDAWVRTQLPGSHLTPLLLDVLPNGSLHLAERGFLNLDYREGLARANPMPPNTWGHGVVPFLPQDYTFRAGHRIGLLLQSSNTVWAVPGAAGTVNVANGPIASLTDVGTRLVLPVVNPPANPNDLFVAP